MPEIQIHSLIQINDYLTNDILPHYNNKKLCYHKEHSMSVMLSWCTLWHFSGENLLMVNQPLLLYGHQKVPNLPKWCKIRVITPI